MTTHKPNLGNIINILANIRIAPRLSKYRRDFFIFLHKSRFNASFIIKSSFLFAKHEPASEPTHSRPNRAIIEKFINKKIDYSLFYRKTFL